jgi:hypothetical protein
LYILILMFLEQTSTISNSNYTPSNHWMMLNN